MFRVQDKIASRHKTIRTELKNGAAVPGVLMAAADFERSYRRSVLAFGKQSTKTLRELLKHVNGDQRFRKMWKAEVGGDLTTIVTNWEALTKKAYPIRHRLIHGDTITLKPDYAVKIATIFLDASMMLHEYAARRGRDLDTRIVRRQRQ